MAQSKKERQAEPITAKRKRDEVKTATDRNKQGTQVTCEERSEYVVAIDFGTTFSGASFARVSDLLEDVRDAVQIFENWPGQAEAGARAYCKTQTSLWYVDGSTEGEFVLKGWGWKGYVDYKRCLEKLKRDYEPQNMSGYFLTNFKLELESKGSNLPSGLSVDRVISDYLRELTRFIVREMKLKYGNSAKQSAIQYILTVPVFWSESSKQTMRKCAEMAGPVTGPLSDFVDNEASAYDLIIVSEPEAAAVYVHKTCKSAQFSDGNRFLVVDIGGGTTDVVVHEKIGLATRRNIKVREERARDGGLVGGVDVDESFFSYLRNRNDMIGCFSQFESRYPLQMLEINRWWNDIKFNFSGDPSAQQVSLPSPAGLARGRSVMDKAKCIRRNEDFYDDILIDHSALTKAFEVVVFKILEIIEKNLPTNLRAICLVGGFSESPYLQMRIQESFASKADIIFVPHGGSAVVKGAIYFGRSPKWSGMISSRISPMTYGFDTSVKFIDGEHKPEYLVVDGRSKAKREMCDNIFGVIVRRGDEIPLNFEYKETIHPLYRKGRWDKEDVVLNLYSSPEKRPLYVTDKGVQKLSTCVITVPKTKPGERDRTSLVISVRFSTVIDFSVEGKYFSSEKVFMAPVQVNWVSQSQVPRF